MNISMGTPHVLGIEINEYCTRVVEMNYKSRNPRIYQLFEFETPEGMLEDGRIVSFDAFAAKLTGKCIEMEIRTRRVIFSVMSNRIMEKEAVVPAMKGARLKEMLRLNAEDYFPVNVSEYVLSYEIIEKMADERRKGQYRLSIKAIPQDLLKSYHQLAAACGMQLVQIDYAMNGMFQMIQALQEGQTFFRKKTEETDDVLRIYILPNEEHTKLLLVQNRKLMLQRALTQTMEEEEDLARAILRVLDFYLSRPGASGSQMEVTLLGFAEYEYIMTVLRERLGVEVQVFRSAGEKSFFANKIFSDEEISSYAPAIGSCIHPLGLRMKGEVGSGDEFSLLEFVLNDSVQTTIAVTLMLLGVILGMQGAFYLAMGLYDYRSYRTAIQDQELQIAELNALKTAKDTYDATYQEYKNMLEISDYMKTANDSVLDFIEELEELLPSDAEVTEIQFSESGAAVKVEVTSWTSIAYTIMQFREMETAALIEESLPTEYMDKGTAAGYSSVQETAAVASTDYNSYLDAQLRQECLTRMKKYPMLVNAIMQQNGVNYTEEELTNMINQTSRADLIRALQQSDLYISSMEEQEEEEQLPEHLYELTAQFVYQFDVLPALRNLNLGTGQGSGNAAADALEENTEEDPRTDAEDAKENEEEMQETVPEEEEAVS